VLLHEAERLGTRVVLNTKVVGLDAHNGTVTSEDDREVTADVIVGGDGTYRNPTFGNSAHVVRQVCGQLQGRLCLINFRSLLRRAIWRTARPFPWKNSRSLMTRG
jgi:2-polyprenyl-6-methoxyphenol hydroxylase-like FAD-dependent oxidoreductase